MLDGKVHPPMDYDDMDLGNEEEGFGDNSKPIVTNKRY